MQNISLADYYITNNGEIKKYAKTILMSYDTHLQWDNIIAWCKHNLEPDTFFISHFNFEHMLAIQFQNESDVAEFTLAWGT